ncbi:CTD kinase subunit gamma CTK3-domain-containing protein [Suillus ampliporus]|nr:CTD kinase subunit gamma CTK3-domain-containing protein [Suillus ampliporus]
MHDPFEVRMQFLGLIRKLNASQQSIQKVVGFALKYFSRCGEDLWECIIEECQKGSINHRINILYFLDSLCETSLLAKAHQLPEQGSSSSKQINNALYVDYVSRDLTQIVECVVPVGRQGLPNLPSTKQILENWRTKRIIEPQKVDEVLSLLSSRDVAPDATSTSAAPSTTAKSEPHLSRGEIFKRIEEDRERHKRLRERRWVQAQPHSGPAVPSYSTFALASFLPLSDAENAELALDIEFENEWEATSDWNEDDVEATAEERELCHPHLRRRGLMNDEDEGEQEMDIDMS